MQNNIKLFILGFAFLASPAFGQFLDFNIFKPHVSFLAESVFDNPSDSLSVGVMNYNVSALIPIKQKFDVDLNFGNILKSKGLKDAFGKVVTPKFYQVFARVGSGYRTYNSELFRNPVDIYNFSAGISGINLKMKSGKFKFFMYSFNLKLQEELNKYKTVSPSVSGLFGAVKVFDFKTALFYGMYANYFGGRVLPAPVIALYYKLNKKSSITLAVPYQLKYDINFGKIKQDFAVSFNAYNNGVYNDSLYRTKDYIERLNFQNTQLRFSSQTRFKLSKRAFVYLEAGWQDVNKVQFYEGYENYRDEQLKGNLFVKAKFSMVLGKSLFNPSVFDFDL